jgi:hypothetical protein
VNNDPTRSSNAPGRPLLVTLSAIGILVIIAVVGKAYSALSDLRTDAAYAQEAADDAQRTAQEAKDIAEDAQSTADDAISKAEDTERQLRYR